MADEEQVASHVSQLCDALESLRTADGREYVEVLSRKGVRPASLTCECDRVLAVGMTSQVKVRLRTYDLTAWTHQFLPAVLKEELRSAERPVEERWSLHVCRQYMYDDASSKVKYFWNFILSAQNVEGAVRDLCRLVDLFVTGMRERPVPVVMAKLATQTANTIRTVPVSLDEVPLSVGPILSGGATRVEVGADGHVISIGLPGGADRNRPEGAFFEKGKGQRGVHYRGSDR